MNDQRLASFPADPATAEPLAPAVASATPSTALKLWIVLARASDAVARHAAAHAAEHGLTMAEFGVLEALAHKGPLLLGEIQRAILVSSGGITYLVDRLVARGLVERRDCEEDRRARYAALTAEGERFMRRIFPEHARRLEAALGGLTPEEQELATGLLRRLGRAAAAVPHPEDVAPRQR
jgi:MarR family transcriptional regulator, 2-MHQ and catechol-resistance regulon repressor